MLWLTSNHLVLTSFPRVFFSSNKVYGSPVEQIVLLRTELSNSSCHLQAAHATGRLTGVPATNSRLLPKRTGMMHAPLAWRCRLIWWASVTTMSRYSSRLRWENTPAASTFGLDSTISESKGSSSGVMAHPQRTPPGIEENQTTGAATKIVLRLLQRGSGGMTTIADIHFTSFAGED